MWKSKVLLIGLLLALLSGVSCARASDFDSQLKSVVKPYRFVSLRWESSVISNEVKQWFTGGGGQVGNEVGTVLQYFAYSEQINRQKANAQTGADGIRVGLDELNGQKLALQNNVERIIQRQIREVLSEQGIFNPLDRYVKLKIGFPPLNFKLDRPPYLLVVSPRDRIERTTDVMLAQDITPEDMVTIESKVDQLGVSSLVVPLGGLGATYPSFVQNDASLLFTIDTAVHEWLHQYLAFQPLGFRYVLDITSIDRDRDIATINETVASMVAKEVSRIVYDQYYAAHDGAGSLEPAAKPKLDFDREMWEIRIAVDQYLARGEIARAEEFMAQKRDYLAGMGYRTRKLNQAYFAFYGTYADGPSAVSPIGTMLRGLRGESASLKGFLDTVGGMTSLDDLQKAVQRQSLD